MIHVSGQWTKKVPSYSGAADTQMSLATTNEKIQPGSEITKSARQQATDSPTSLDVWTSQDQQPKKSVHTDEVPPGRAKEEKARRLTHLSQKGFNC